eukprot:11051519-Karenia_brevis.AAC.1
MFSLTLNRQGHRRRGGSDACLAPSIAQGFGQGLSQGTAQGIAQGISQGSHELVRTRARFVRTTIFLSTP